ncbi:MAG TPA: hypothetical protein VF326_08255 [Anaerolineaceae bacterium]
MSPPSIQANVDFVNFNLPYIFYGSPKMILRGTVSILGPPMTNPEFWSLNPP